MSYHKALKHRSHRLHVGPTFNPFGISSCRSQREVAPRVRCPMCTRKFARDTVRWVNERAYSISSHQPIESCRRCLSRVVELVVER